ncbi:MAG: HNH endonuclease [Candidatus Cloacimonetes bacterium]|nr:HNH endonuclease [Candidatus Cloacimonadota bacterium]
MQNLHQKITETVTEYRKQEGLLIELTQEADFTKLFLELGYSSLFEYLNQGQGISAATVSNLITVARKAVQIPAMKDAIDSGEVGLAKLRKVSSVITSENKSEWIEKSKKLSCRELEKEVAKVSTYKPRRDFWQRINADYFRLSIDTTEGFKALAERAQDVYSKKCQANKTLTEVFEWALNEALNKYDPLIKAERAEAKKKSVTVKAAPISKPDPTSQSVTDNKRQHIPQHILNQVILRDKGRCSFQKNGRRCNHRRFLDIHHIKPVKDGGQNTVENLAILCETHHIYLHNREEIERSLALIRQFRMENE